MRLARRGAALCARAFTSRGRDRKYGKDGTRCCDSKPERVLQSARVSGSRGFPQVDGLLRRHAPPETKPVFTKPKPSANRPAYGRFHVQGRFAKVGTPSQTQMSFQKPPGSLQGQPSWNTGRFSGLLQTPRVDQTKCTFWNPQASPKSLLLQTRASFRWVWERCLGFQKGSPFGNSQSPRVPGSR